MNPSFSKAIFLFTIILHGLFLEEVPYDNIMSRLGLVFSLAEHGTFHIDPFAHLTEDKAFYKGHYYCDKAPGISFLGVPVYLVWKGVNQALGNPWGLNSFRFLLRTLIISLPTALLAMGLWRLLLDWGGREFWATWWTVGYVAGTSVLPYSTVLYDHQAAALCCFGGWLLLRREGVRTSLPKAFLTGLLLGSAWFGQYPAAALTAVLFLGACFLWWDKKALLRALGTGIAVMVLAMGLYNYASFDNPLTLSYKYKNNAVFKEIHSQGLYGIAIPQPIAAYVMLFSPHKGLFFFSPFLLLAIPGAFGLLKMGKIRREVLVFVSAVTAYILMFSSFVDYEAGYSFGPRHLIPIFPFLAALLGGMQPTGWRRGAALGLTFYSIGVMVYGTLVSLHIPYELPNPLYSFFYPLLKVGYTSASLHVLGGMAPKTAVLITITAIIGFLAWFAIKTRATVADAAISVGTVALLTGLVAVASISLTPLYPEQDLILGDICSFKELDAGVAYFYGRAPQREEALRRLLKYHTKKQDLPRSIEAARGVFTLTGQEPDAVAVAELLLVSGKTREAEGFLGTVSQSQAIRYCRGLLLLELGDLELSAQFLEAEDVKMFPQEAKAALSERISAVLQQGKRQ